MTFKKSALLVLTVVCSVSFALKHHVVRAKDAFLLIEKQTSSFHDTYVDIRDWNGDEWSDHTELTASLFVTR